MQTSFVRVLSVSGLTMLTLVLCSGLIMATLLRFGSISESTMTGATIGITIAITFIGGFAAGLRSRSKGWLVGLLAGVTFVFVAVLLQYLGYGMQLSLNQALVFTGSIISAAFGGMLSVSLFSAIR
ncbi:TIGR04086 family membrane protein [Natribacillus halophilus]|uniref:Putative membrane protein, TIGR04086 family n=1 Tax=Natribacillus halophilus TaxID=549003 RepID=A0A1G8NYA2_9BACI|nr:TIGR04086 family membrane protein [Natribacillus halophilus]SDI85222.1 putative membrane protein, TIGR04086 family [Natribacillus halophilus]